jgi:hypothetical protein
MKLMEKMRIESEIMEKDDSSSAVMDNVTRRIKEWV